MLSSTCCFITSFDCVSNSTAICCLLCLFCLAFSSTTNIKPRSQIKLFNCNYQSPRRCLNKQPFNIRNFHQQFLPGNANPGFPKSGNLGSPTIFQPRNPGFARKSQPLFIGEWKPGVKIVETVFQFSTLQPISMRSY